MGSGHPGRHSISLKHKSIVSATTQQTADPHMLRKKAKSYAGLQKKYMEILRVTYPQ